MLRKLCIIMLIGLMASLLGACGSNDPQKTGDSFIADITAALNSVPGVVASKTTYTDPGGMGALLNVRITADSGADVKTVMSDSLRAFSVVSETLKGVSRVEFYVFPQGDEENGIRPDVVALPQAPTVADIRGYAAGSK